MQKNNPHYAVNDHLVKDMVNDPHHQILRDGTVLTQLTKSGKVSINGDWRVKHINIKKGGYCYVKFSGKHLPLHRVMYEAFVGELDPNLTINHKDGNPSNNDPNNLELATMAEQNLHSFRRDGSVRTKPVHHVKLGQELADKIREEHEAGSSYGVLSKKYGVSKGHISMIINRKIW